MIKLVNSGKVRRFRNSRILLHALGRIRAVEVVAGRGDLRVDIKRSNTGITDIRRLNVIIADCVGHIGVACGIMEPKCVTGIYIHLVAGYDKRLTVCQLDRCAVTLADGADDRVVGNAKISSSTLQVDAACVVVEDILVQRNLSARTLSHERILRIGRSIECAVLDSHFHIKVLIAVKITIERAAIELIGGRIQGALIGSGGHRLDAVEGDILALEGGVDTVRNIPPVVRQSKCTVDLSEIEGRTAVAADNVDPRDVAAIAKAVGCTPEGEHSGIGHALIAVDRPCDLTAISEERIESFRAQRLFSKAAVCNQHSLDSFIRILNRIVGVGYAGDAADGHALLEFICCGTCVILVAEAVFFVCILSSVNGNADAINSKILIFIAGSFLHMTLDGESISRLTGRQIYLGQIDSGIVDRPINNLIELCIALNTGDLNLVLQSKVAFVDNTELRQLVCTARLPKDLVGGSIVCALESKGLTLCTFPTAVRLLHFKSHIQLTGLDLVYRSGCGVGELRKGGAHQHAYTQQQGNDGGKQCRAGCIFAFHYVLSSLF